MYKINEPTKEIAAWHDRWKRNRDFVEGEAAVKKAGEKYLPKARVDDSQAEYEAHKQRTGFFPASYKIVQGWNGLIFRKAAKRNIASARVQLLSNVVTRDNRSMDAVSQFVTKETMITNFTVSLTDHPSRDQFPETMSVAQELRLGYRPYEALYVGESILEVTQGIIDETRVGFTHLRFLENDRTRVRQCLINDAGFYEVRIHDQVEGGDFVETSRVVPTLDGKPLTEIPATVINTDDSIVPTASMIQHVVDLNLQHYINEGSLAAAIHLTSAPIAITTGYTPEIDPATNKPKEVNFPIAPGAHWMFAAAGGTGENQVDTKWFTYDPKGQELVTNKLRDLKDALSAIGHSILAPEKPAPEAAETQLIRRAAENAMLADFTNKVGAQIEKVWQRFALWADPKNPSLTYELNVDFLPQVMDAQRGTFLSTLVEKRQLSQQTFHEALEEGEIMPHGFDPKQEAARIEQETVDRPPLL